jgi:hypothetical protein
MAHYAKVLDGKVTQVIVAEPDFFKTFVDSSPGTWIQTSYNTYGGIHATGGTPLRANYAGIGHTYDAINDVFYAPQPYPSWTISAPSWQWQSPVPYPTDGKAYKWDEAIKSWVLFPVTV